MEPWSLGWKEEQYRQIKAAWRDCTSCPLSKNRNNVVFGSGNLNAKIMMIGECPGKEEDRKGEPFVGQAGQFLDMLMDAAGISKDDVFMDNLVACKVPEGRDPQASEKELCKARLEQVIYLVDPLLIVAVGKAALSTLTGGRSWSIETEHGMLFSSPHPSARITGERNGLSLKGKVFPKKGDGKLEYTLEYDVVGIYHPAYILRVDSPNPDTQEFEPGRPTHHTVEDLRYIRERVAKLDAAYRVIHTTIERNRE
jgi:uracil-DNA glycosylase